MNRQDVTVKPETLKLVVSLKKPDTIVKFYKKHPKKLIKNIFISLFISLIGYLIGFLDLSVIGAIICFFLNIIVDIYKFKKESRSE